MNIQRLFLSALACTAATLAPASLTAQIYNVNGRALTICAPEDQPDMFATMTREGFRMLSIDVYGREDLGTVTAVWTAAPGPAWVSYHFLEPQSYQAKADYWSNLGFRLSRVAHSGADEKRFACLMEDDGALGFGKHGQTYSEFRATMTEARRAGYMLESISVSGERQLRFHSTWIENPKNVDWELIGGLDAASYQNVFDNFVALGYGPHFVTVWKDQPNKKNALYYAILRKPLGFAWAAYHHVDLSAHPAKIQELRRLGYTPRHVARGGWHFCGVWQR